MLPVCFVPGLTFVLLTGVLPLLGADLGVSLASVGWAPLNTIAAASIRIEGYGLPEPAKGHNGP